MNEFMCFVRNKPIVTNKQTVQISRNYRISSACITQKISNLWAIFDHEILRITRSQSGNSGLTTLDQAVVYTATDADLCWGGSIARTYTLRKL